MRRRGEHRRISDGTGDVAGHGERLLSSRGREGGLPPTRVRDLMSPQVFSVPPDTSVRDTAERMVRERRMAFASSLDGVSSIGLVTLEAVKAEPPERRTQTPAREIAVETPLLSPGEDAAKALRLMTETDVPELAVAEEGRLIGSISRDDILRALRLSELERTQPAGA